MPALSLFLWGTVVQIGTNDPIELSYRYDLLLYEGVIDWQRCCCYWHLNLTVQLLITGYSILRRDRNRKGGGIACYIRSDLCYNETTPVSNKIEYIFVDIFIPKVKIISVGIFYRSPRQTNVLEKLNQDFKNFIEINKNEI